MISIFGYGSLINRDSIAKTTKRLLKADEIKPVMLAGFQRMWNFSWRVYAHELQKPVNAIFLNIKAQQEGQTNGVVFEVTEPELELLIKRERFYDITDVSKNLDSQFHSPVYTFICKDPGHIAETNSEGYVMKVYNDIILAGCNALGAEFLNKYFETTPPHSFPTVLGAYDFLAT